jgi:glycosyltransferase involved in cell wall biosynthesis
MKRLCMVVHGPYPIGEPRVQRETRAAIGAGWEVDVLAMRREGEPVEETLPTGERVLRLPLEHRRGAGALGVVHEYAAFTFLAAWRLYRLARSRRYDVVQVHNPPDFLVLAALPCRVRFGSRIVFDVHDLAPDMFAMRFGGHGWSGLVERLLLVCERLALRLADEVLTVHEPYARELRARGAHPARLSIVMNSVDPAVLPPRRRVTTEGFRVVYHGTVTPSYGVDLLIDAAALAGREVPDLRVDIYGEGDAIPSLREQAERLGLGDAVFFHDRYLPQREVLVALAGASAGVVPNRPSRLNTYALSSKLLEYVELGIPAIVARLPTLAEHFDESEVLFFSGGDAADLARALVETASDPTRAKRRASAACRRARAYSWDESAARYVAALARAGTPATTVPGSTSAVTTAPAPTSAPAPTVTPPSTIAPEPRLAPRSTTVGSSSQSSPF